MRYYIIAGEASGDLHGSNLIRSFYKTDPNPRFRFWGGDLMRNWGCNLVKHYRYLSFMGFWEVFLNLRTILKNIKFCKKDIIQFQPDVIIYIDYPGFNLRIAQWAKKKGFKNHYYISPQIWAWKESRIKKIKRDIDKMYVILPFEKEYYIKKHKMPVTYVGHPLLDSINLEKTHNKKRFLAINKLDLKKKIVAFLPGSRKQEIKKMLPLFLEVSTHFSEYQFIVAAAPGIEKEYYYEMTNGYNNIKILKNATHEILKNAYAALVTSGTATLETALFKVPQIVCYKTSFLSYLIAKQIIRLSYISLVNLIFNKQVLTELIQRKCKVKNIMTVLEKILIPKEREKLIKKYDKLETILKEKGASDTVAKLVFESIKT